MDECLVIDGQSLQIEEIFSVAHSTLKVKLCPKALEKMKSARNFVLKIASEEKAVYGINTGFGALASKKISRDNLGKLQINLIRSHCTGVGRPFAKEISRAIMLLRANCLASGHSGVNPDIVQLLLDFLNKDIIPVIPEKGSVGASGDLAPLSHIALALIGEGEVFFENKIQNSLNVMKEQGLSPAILGPKDGLALINGTAVMTALGALSIIESERLMKLADLISSITLEGIKGTDKAFHPKISERKPHPGQLQVVRNFNKILQGSQIKDSHPDCHKVQDPYSLRCIPQVHGASRQTLIHAKEVINTEVNAVTDNPLVFFETEEVFSGGNFHGQAISFAMDYLALGLAEICSMSERRIEKMMNSTFSELPSFLTKDSGLNSGLMIAHVTAAALTSENKVLCHPASVDSIPTSTDKEDHVSMGVTSGRKLYEIIFNVKSTLAIELLCNTTALDFQRPLKSSPVIEKIYEIVRSEIPEILEDRIFSKDIEKIIEIIDSNRLIKESEKLLGGLE